MRVFFSCVAAFFILIQHAASSDSDPSLYIVQLAQEPTITIGSEASKVNPESPEVMEYVSFLEHEHRDVIESTGGQLVQSYRFSFNGFSAMLSPAQAQAMRNNPNVQGVWENEVREMETVSTPEFMGLTGSKEPWSKGYTGENVIIGVIDGGINANHPSFADTHTPVNGNTGDMESYGPPPAGWNGTGCAFGNTDFNPEDASFICGNKLLSARCFVTGFSETIDPNLPCGGDGANLEPDEFLSARDANDHGTHCASVAAGNYGVEAVIKNETLGMISGIAPRARIAVYKVCWRRAKPEKGGGCSLNDIMAAIDQAVADGVDVISYSLGGSGRTFDRPDDIAFLRAAAAGIHVTTSQGNSGPRAGTVGTPAGVPWITAVGAIQDDSIRYQGLYINNPASLAGNYYTVEANSPVRLDDDEVINGQLEPAVPLDACTPLQNNFYGGIGKIPLVIRGGCSFSLKFYFAAQAGASVIIVYNDGAEPNRVEPMRMAAPNTTIPGFQISYSSGDRLAQAYDAGETVTATVGEVAQGNRVAEFSSRGPNRGALDIIKPDVVAPGMRIVAAGTPFEAGRPDDGRQFEIMSGTSMSNPHVAGMLALLKQAHPEWSPAVAKSAMMTTARQDIKKEDSDKAADPFDIGSGFVVPEDAFDPGLAFDVGLEEYQAFSCGNNNPVVSETKCEELAAMGYSFDGSELNYPSIGVSALVGSKNVTRTVTFMAETKQEEEFNVSVDPPPGVNVVVVPNKIKLKGQQSETYKVELTATDDLPRLKWEFGSMTWTSGKKVGKKSSKYTVRSPIAVRRGRDDGD